MCETEFNSANKTNATFEGCSRLSRSLKVAYVNFPPYIFTNQLGKPTGIFKDMFENYIRNVCPTFSNGIDWMISSEIQTSNLIQSCITNNNCDFAIGSNSYASTTSLYKAPVSTFHAAPKIGFVTLKADDEERIYTVFRATTEKIWPLFIVTMELIFFTGTLVWLCERTENSEEFPTTFVQGAYEAFWWSFISFTTVGYGDKSPITLTARIISIFWILIGIIFIGMIAAILSASLSEANEFTERSMDGLTVGCLDISSVAKVAIIENGGEPRCYSNFNMLERDIALGYVHGFAMDYLELQYYTKNKLSRLGTKFYVYQKAYTLNQVYNLAHFPVNDDKFQKCSKMYADFNNQNQKIMESRFKTPFLSLLDKKIINNEKTSRGVWILEPESSSVRNTMLYLGLLIILIILIGISFDIYNKYFNRSSLSINKGYENSKQKQDDQTWNSRKEKQMTELIDQTLHLIDDKIRDTQITIRRDIQELAKRIQKESKNNVIPAVFDRDRPFSMHSNFPMMFPNDSSLHSKNLNGLLNISDKTSTGKHLNIQY